MIVLDTSGLLVALDAGATHHEPCRRVLEQESGPLLLSPFVLAEADYLVTRRLGARVALDLLGEVGAGAYDLAPVDPDFVAAAADVAQRYADLELGLTDASLVVLAARGSTTRLLTFDHRHFRAVRPLQGGAFTLLPADG